VDSADCAIGRLLYHVEQRFGYKLCAAAYKSPCRAQREIPPPAAAAIRGNSRSGELRVLLSLVPR
jgi:hypothetical protein